MFFVYFISSSASRNWIRTLKLGIMSWLLYHFATATGWVRKSCFLLFSLSWCQQQLDSNPRTWDHELVVLLLCYCCGLSRPFMFFGYFISRCQTQLDLNTRTWDHELIILPLCYCCMLSQPIIFFVILSLLVPPEVRFKPSNLGSWVDCSTTLLLLRAESAINVFGYFISRCQKQLDLNPRTWDHELIVLPLSYCCGLSRPFMFFGCFISQCQKQLDLNTRTWDHELTVLPLCLSTGQISQSHFLLTSLS